MTGLSFSNFIQSEPAVMCARLFLYTVRHESCYYLIKQTTSIMKINYYGFTLYSGDDTRAKWELKHYWQDGVTVECRYFATQREAKRFALHDGYLRENYVICRNKHVITHHINTLKSN